MEKGRDITARGNRRGKSTKRRKNRVRKKVQKREKENKRENERRRKGKGEREKESLLRVEETVVNKWRVCGSWFQFFFHSKHHSLSFSRHFAPWRSVRNEKAPMSNEEAFEQLQKRDNFFVPICTSRTWLSRVAKKKSWKKKEQKKVKKEQETKGSMDQGSNVLKAFWIPGVSGSITHTFIINN